MRSSRPARLWLLPPHASQQSRTIEGNGTGCSGSFQARGTALEVPVRAEEAGLERWSAPDSAHLDGARSGAAGVAQREHVPPTLVECVCPAHPGLPCRHAHPAPGLPCRPARPAPELPCRHAHMPGAPPDHSLPVGRTSVPIPDLSRAVLRVPCSLHTWVEA